MIPGTESVETPTFFRIRNRSGITSTFCLAARSLRNPAETESGYLVCDECGIATKNHKRQIMGAENGRGLTQRLAIRPSIAFHGYPVEQAVRKQVKRNARLGVSFGQWEPRLTL